MSINVNIKAQSFLYTSEERIKKSDELYALLTNILNKVHKTNYSERFWKIILAPFESTIISSWQILEEDNLRLEPPTILHVNSLDLSKNERVFSKIRYLVKAYRSKGALKKIKKQLEMGKSIALDLPYQEEMSIAIDSNMDSYYPFFKSKKVDLSSRNIILDDHPTFSKIFITNIVKMIPKIYVEYFNTLMSRIPLINPIEKVFHVTMFHSPFMRFVVAKYVENGAQLFMYQHGGFYGEYKYHSGHHIEGGIADKFKTWGWRIKENDEPSPAYKLEHFRRRYIKKKNNLFDILIIYPIIRERNRDHVKEESEVFFSKINRNEFPMICARPRPTANINRRAVLHFIEKNVSKIDSGFTDILELISASRLIIIFTHPSTTLLECLYVDHPTVAILDSGNAISEIAKPHYNYLLKAGLLHDSMNSLVDHINKVNLEEWWNNLVKQPEYQQFKQEFLRKV